MIKWWYQDSAYKNQFQVSFPSFALLLFKIRSIILVCTESQQLQPLVISVKAEFSISISYILSVHSRFDYSFKVYRSSKHWIRALCLCEWSTFFLQLISLCFTDPSSSPSIPQAAHFTISLSTQFHLRPHQFLHWS